MDKSLKDKVVIITGATAGIGKALAYQCAAEGAKLTLTGRNAEALQAITQDLQAKGTHVLPIVADVSLEADNARMVADTIAQFGQIDVLVNNAGISMRGLFEDTEVAVLKQVMDINFYGAVYATKYALPHLLRSRGAIVAISSINGYRSTPARTGYSASKFAMNGFFEALRTEVMYRGVHVLVVAPGFTGTEIRKRALNAQGEAQGESPRDEKNMMTAEEVAIRTLRALRAKRRSLVLTRQGKLAVWLNKFLPAMMDRIVYRVMAREPDSPLK